LHKELVSAELLLKSDLPQKVSVGQIVCLRQRSYLVEQITRPVKPTDSTLVRLSCIDDDAQGQPLQVLWERELDAEVLTGEAWDAIADRGFDPARLFAAYYNTLRWNCVTATDPQLFQSPFRAGIHLEAYQLEPLQKALLLPRVNLLIADDVGLGKTIEAGLIARELLLRKKAREIIVFCPPSMLLQWKDELDNRFGLSFEILDKDYVQRVRRERGFGINPWSTHSRFLVSHRLLIDETYAGPLRDQLGNMCPGSLLILDEAHHAAPASGQKYAIDSQITRTIRDLAPRFEHRLFLSATPHNGHSNSFSALLEILDPQRFCRGVPVEKSQLDAIMVRRLKEDLRAINIGDFAQRRIVQLTIDNLPADAAELRLAALLDEYRAAREERTKSLTKKQQAASGLLLTGLQQRLFSSIEAFARTLRVHRNTVKRQWDESASQAPAPSSGALLDLLTSSPGNDDDRATLPEAEVQAEEDAQVASASATSSLKNDSELARKQFDREQHLLDEMTAIAEKARYLADARVTLLKQWIKKNMCLEMGKAGAKWNNLRIIIFTEYDDTKRYLHDQLQAAIAESQDAEHRIAIYHGPTPVEDREAIKQAFNGDPEQHRVRILIATDAAREGLNLQAHCWNLFHFDVPWNPSRMEQRNGRIDRKLQANPEVFCHYFVYAQRPEDRIIQALIRKTERIKAELGSLSQVIDNKLTDTLKHGIRRNSLSELERAVEQADLDADSRQTVDAELESSRRRQDDLRRQVDGLSVLVQKSRKSIGLEEMPFRQAILAALDLQKLQSLEPLPDNSQQVPRFQFPAIDEKSMVHSNWADTLDSLRVPRKRDQKLWEWRRSSPLRPVVFKDPGKLDDEVVHLHLEHRIVQRLLNHFTAQGFVQHDLSRAALVQSTDDIPRVILLGRLCLYGPYAARLHEEILCVTAKRIAPQIRKGTLTPYELEDEKETMQLFQKALEQRDAKQLNKALQKELQAFAPREVKELLPHLEAKAKKLEQESIAKLIARGKEEASAMKKILDTQRKHIAKAEAKHLKAETQNLLPFIENMEEQRQYESNRRHWNKRLAELEKEMETEPKRITELYQVHATRMEPVGLIYLWPESMSG
jgi:SNF2 family DNA or RNA helicase